MEVIAELSRGDARRALDVLELSAHEAARTARPLDEALAGATLVHDKSGEGHYNVVSAFIKSMRGSDPDAALYWMMRMLEAGEDPLFVLRRMLIFASEDIGNADPQALVIAVAADQAFQRLGMPEGLHTLGQCCVYLACAPKSNACNVAWHRAQAAVRERGALPVPLELRNAVTPLMKREGYGEGYRYAHNEEGAVATGAVYLPEQLVGQRFYEPTERGYEKMIAERLKRIRGE